jgi:hypothetical protein
MGVCTRVPLPVARIVAAIGGIVAAVSGTVVVGSLEIGTRAPESPAIIANGFDKKKLS